MTDEPTTTISRRADAIAKIAVDFLDFGGDNPALMLDKLSSAIDDYSSYVHVANRGDTHCFSYYNKLNHVFLIIIRLTQNSPPSYGEFRASYKSYIPYIEIELANAALKSALLD